MPPPRERHRRPQPPVTPRKETGRGHQSKKSEDRQERRPGHDSAGPTAPRRAPAPAPTPVPAPAPAAPSKNAADDAAKATRAAAAIKAAKAAAAAAAIEAAIVDSSDEEEEEEEEDDDDDEEDDDEDDEDEDEDDSDDSDEEEEETARAQEAARRAKVAQAAKAAEEARAARAAKAAEATEATRVSQAETAEAARALEAARVAKVIEAARAAEATRAAAAAAAIEAAATAPTFSSPPANSATSPAANPAPNNSTATNPQANANEPNQTHTTANGEVVETLYSHPTAKIISFSAGGRNFMGDIPATAARTRNRRSTSEEEVAAGTLDAAGQFERTIAVGALCIYRAPGSVAFLSCGSALQPILPKSQCWCIDEDSGRFILQIRRPQYWRIEVPVGDGGENDGRAQRLREVLDYILQFEKTPCPFKRSFTVELPDQPSTPMKKKPWTPVKRNDMETPPTPVTPSVAGAQPKTQQPQRSPSPPDEDSTLSTSPRQMHSSPLGNQTEFSRREWAAMLQSQRKGSIDLEEERKRIVPALIAEHERIISEAMAGDLEVERTGHVWRNSIASFMPPETDRHGNPRERSMSMIEEGSGSRPAWPGLDQTWFEMESDRSTAESSSPFNSLRSWLSAGRNMASSPPSSAASMAGVTTSDGIPIPPGLASLYDDARRVFAGALVEQPRLPHRATASSISMSNPSAMASAVNILNPNRQLQRYNAGRVRTRMDAIRRIPGTVMVRVMEILLAPPGYLITLMLRVAARILSGEWRGTAVGKTDSGENIPVHWDYTDVEDPLGLSVEFGSVDRLNVYTEADVDVYTDVENHDDDDDDDDDDSEVEDAEFSSSGTPTKYSSFSRARASSTASDSAGESDTDTLSDTGGDPIVWTRRWAVD